VVAVVSRPFSRQMWFVRDQKSSGKLSVPIEDRVTVSYTICSANTYKETMIERLMLIIILVPTTVEVNYG